MDNADCGGRTILVVDDEPDLCEIVQRVLQGQGYAVLTAGGFVDALDRGAAHPGPIDLLITDLRMPDGDGRALAARFRARQEETAILYMSGLPNGEECGAGDGAAVAVLAKPFAPADLLTAVHTAVTTRPVAAGSPSSPAPAPSRSRPRRRLR
ncbi:MAG: response regulator transcription factor [Dactylosporangium sp.]|nr:response regulator [Dactylosporangium sp.]NNJ63431.1 response regulator transcription factor [Dactylosporangium sp.]